MMALDVVDSIDNPNATDDRQGVNVRLLTGKLLPEEAAAEAREVNDVLHDSSYKWARALQTALRYGVDLDAENYSSCVAGALRAPLSGLRPK